MSENEIENIKEDELKEFIKRLPELTKEPPCTHLVMLAVRSRKAKKIFGIKMSDIVVERKVIRPISQWRERYFSRVCNLAMLQHFGRYEVKGHYTVPEVMGIYATICPRDVFKATADMMKDNVSYLYQRDESASLQLSRQYTAFFSKLHKFKSRKWNFVTLDIDNDDEKLLKEILDRVSMIPIFMVTETSRGYHIVLDISKSSDARMFYGEEKLMQKLGLDYVSKGLEIQRDSQEPIPGTKYFREDGKLHYVRIIQ